MNPPDETTDFERLVPDQQTPGQILSMAREKAKLSHIDVARELKLRVQWIIDIENDDYDDAAALIYVRGYLKSYAKLVNVLEKEVLDAFSNMDFEAKLREKKSNTERSSGTEEQFVKHQPVLSYSKSPSSGKKIFGKVVLWVGIAVAVAAIGVAVNWWYQHRTIDIKQSPNVVLPAQ